MVFGQGRTNRLRGLTNCTTDEPIPEQRTDGRRPQQLRPFSVTWNPMGFALSSLWFTPAEPLFSAAFAWRTRFPAGAREKDWDGSAPNTLLPGSTPQRQSRELNKLSGRTQEIQRLIGRSLRAVIDMERLGERTLLIDCDVIQADAGTRTASITGAWLALDQACRSLVEQGVLEQSPLVDQVAAVSVGLVDGQALLDLDYSEDSQAEVDLNVVQAGDGRLLEIQGTAEGAPFSRKQLNELLDLAEPGLSSLMQAQRQAAGEHSINR